MWIGEDTTAKNPFADGSKDTYYFQGHAIFEAVVAKIKNKTDETTKTFETTPLPLETLLLTGCSAGGMGTFFNADFLTASFPEAVVKANPEAGEPGTH